MDLNEKVVLITGASSGIGAATAIYFSKQSAKLSLVARNEINLKRIALYCNKSKGVQPLTITADVTNDADIERIINETMEHYGRIDVLINNAGIIQIGGIKNSNMEMYDEVMSTNLRAVYHITMKAVPHLIQSKGCIINISSTTSLKTNALTLAYNLSKAALDQFTKCTALELAGDGVRVNSVNPGYVRTNLLKNTGISENQLDLITKNIVSNIPLNKIVESEDVAALIAFLASDKAKSITGSCHYIDGGSTLQ